MRAAALLVLAALLAGPDPAAALPRKGKQAPPPGTGTRMSTPGA